jgi:hypothetical protein
MPDIAPCEIASTAEELVRLREAEGRESDDHVRTT